MKIKLEIDGVEIDSKYITKFNFEYDSPDTDRAKSGKSDVKLQIEGKLSEDIVEQTLNLANWSIQTSGENLYRKVEIKVSTQENKDVREYLLTRAFILDYLESFDSEIDGKFILKLKQHGERFEDVKIY